MTDKIVNVTVYSDYICPFCYIGYFRIEKLKEKFDLDVNWQPFEIHPETPTQGLMVDQLPFPPGYLDMVLTNVKRLAAEDGIEIQFSGKMPNSRLALYLSEYAREKGKFNQFHKSVLDSYWKKGEDIGDLKILEKLIKSVNLNLEEALSYAKSEKPQKLLEDVRKYLHRCGINGVPTFFIEDRIVVGAQPLEVFNKVISNVLGK